MANLTTFVKAQRVSVNSVEAIYSLNGTEFTVEWNNIHPATGEITDYDLQLIVKSDDYDLAQRVSEAIRENETDSNPDLDLYLEVRDTFDSMDAKTKELNSSTFEEAKLFFENNKQKILSLLLKELEGEIEYQSEYNQVAVWFKDFSLCYQNGDMAGNRKGEAIWNNDGANSGVQELRDLIANDPRFAPLYAEDEYWSYEYVDGMVALFCDAFAERNNIESMLAEDKSN